MTGKRKNRFITLLILLSFIVCLFPGISVAADEIGILAVYKGSSSIAASGKLVTFSGSSSSLVIEDTLSVYIYLQEKQGTTWVTIDSSSKSENNTTSVLHSKSKLVSGRRHYRTRSYHQSITGGVAYGFYTYSNEIYVP